MDNVPFRGVLVMTYLEKQWSYEEFVNIGLVRLALFATYNKGKRAGHKKGFLEGEIKGTQHLLIMQIRRRFDNISKKVIDKIHEIKDIAVLYRIDAALFDTKNVKSFEKNVTTILLKCEDTFVITFEDPEPAYRNYNANGLVRLYLMYLHDTGHEEGYEKGLLEGEIKGTQDLLLSQMCRRFGYISLRLFDKIQQVQDIEALEFISIATVGAESMHTLEKGATIILSSGEFRAVPVRKSCKTGSEESDVTKAVDLVMNCVFSS
jgi:hypothetical protein